MNLEIIWFPQASKYVKKLPKDIAKRILEKIDEVITDPFRYLEHFEGEGYKLRIGDYRAIVDVDFSGKMIKIRMFDKRGRIYE